MVTMRAGSPQTMVGSGGGELYRCCFLLLAGLGITALSLWLALRPKEPECSISSFIVPALNRTTNATTNSAIVFMVEFDNGNKELGIRYHNINFTIGVFLDRNKTSLIGSSTIAGFYQGHNKNAKKWSSVETQAGAINRMVKVVGKTYFRVNFTTSVKYKILFFYTAQHRLWGGANVAVDDAGLKVEEDSISLEHSLPVIVSSVQPLTAGCYRILLVLGLLIHFVGLGLLL